MTVRFWSYPSRISSPWTISLVHGLVEKVMLAAPANGAAGVSASEVQGPEMRGEVHERRYPCPSPPKAWLSRRYWPVPANL